MIFKSINPQTLETVASYPTFSETQIDQALVLAQKAYTHWQQTSFKERSEKMLQVAQILRSRKEVLAHLITTEMGKILPESYAEIEKCATHCEYFSAHSETFLQDVPIQTETYQSIVSFEPVGAILAIMPWNYPFWQVFRYLAPTVMAGNISLLKHAPNVIGCGIAIEDIFIEAGFPPGVFQNMILDTNHIERIIQANIIQGVTLTGSERAGTSVAAIAGKHIKKSVMELGGSDPFIVLEDADIQKAARIAVQSRFLNAGQACICAKRFIVVDRVFDDFLDAFQQEMQTYKQGDPLNSETRVGPMARIDLAQKLKTQLDQSISQGARLLMGGQVSDCAFTPTLLGNIHSEMTVFQEETFGPLAAILGAKDAEQAIRIANQSRYGLAASLWTKNLDHAYQLSKKIEAGNVFVNSLVRSDSRLPFGGIKKSGFGRELSDWGQKEFTNMKTIVIEEMG